MKTKLSLLLTGAAIIVVLSVLYFDVEKLSQKPTPNTDITATSTTDTPSNQTEQPMSKIRADMFTGVLERVDTGCFSDGECSVTVNGKHVTILVGRSQEVVGTIIGAPSIGDLEASIGKPVEIYARDNADGTYSLYGSEGFYVKVLGETASSTIPSTITSSSSDRAACVVGGCSGQICTDASAEPVVTDCMYRPEYACYKTATCERQSSGQCGWTQTPALTACLATPPNTTEPLPQ